MLISFGPVVSTDVFGIQIDERLVSSLDHGLLSSSGNNVSVLIRMETLVKIPPDPDSGIVKFLVWFLGSIRVTDLSLQISLVLLVEQPQSVPVGPLSVGVDVHLDDSIVDGVPDLLLTGARPPVHHQEQRFVVLTAQLLLGKVLVTLQKVRREHHVARFVDSVDVTEGSSDGEHGAYGGKCLMDFEHLQGRVQVVEGLR